MDSMQAQSQEMVRRAHHIEFRRNFGNYLYFQIRQEKLGRSKGRFPESMEVNKISLRKNLKQIY